MKRWASITPDDRPDIFTVPRAYIRDSSRPCGLSNCPVQISGSHFSDASELRTSIPIGVHEVCYQHPTLSILRFRCNSQKRNHLHVHVRRDYFSGAAQQHVSAATHNLLAIRNHCPHIRQNICIRPMLRDANDSAHNVFQPLPSSQLHDNRRTSLVLHFCG